MSNDRKLLELAAKAAGEITPSWYGNQNYLDGVLGRWNPLTDDGDALRLAVKLGIDVYIDPPHCGAQTVAIVLNNKSIGTSEGHGADPYAATRRAIVKAAAEIGRGMP